MFASTVITNNAGQTLLSLAYSNRHLETVKYLVQEQRCNPNCMLCFLPTMLIILIHSVVVNKDGDTPLFLLCSIGNLEWVKALINEDIDPRGE